METHKKEQQSEIHGRERKVTKRSSPVHRLKPIVDKDGILHIGVRISQASLAYASKASCLVTKERAPQRPDSSPFSPTCRPPGSSKNPRRNPFVRLLDNGW